MNLKKVDTTIGNYFYNNKKLKILEKNSLKIKIKQNNYRNIKIKQIIIILCITNQIMTQNNYFNYLVNIKLKDLVILKDMIQTLNQKNWRIIAYYCMKLQNKKKCKLTIKIIMKHKKIFS